MIASPEDAIESACPMVLKAAVGDLQSWMSLPLTPLTYHVVADAIEVRARCKLSRSRILWLNLMARLRVENCRSPKPDAEGKNSIKRPREGRRTRANKDIPS